MFKNIPRHILTILTVAVAILLAASALSAYINPKNLSIFAFSGFAFPVLWLFNLGLMAINALRKNWRRLALGAVVALSTIAHWNNSFQINNLWGNKEPKKENVTIMSFNTRMFDFYDWTKRKNVIDDVMTFVRQKNPDVVCFQEFFTYDKRERYAEHRIVNRLNAYKYRHIEYNVIGKNGKRFGQATFSKYPIVAQKRIKFEGTSNFSIQTDIRIGNKTVRVFNNHLESIRLSAKNYNFIDSINSKSDAERKAGIRDIGQKLTHALAQRAEQAEIIARHIGNSPYPVIVCGDFNDTPVSFVYRTMRGSLNDAFGEAGKGIGGTYNGKLPSFRIDFIFHDETFSTERFETYKVDFSDHYPIMAEINLNN